MVKWIPKWFRSTPIPYYAFSIAITALYVSFPSCTLFFQVSYGAMVLLMSISLHFYAREIPSGASVQVLLKRAAVFVIFAFAVWNVDNLLCGMLRRLRTEYLPAFLGPMLQFHAWWHILTMISGLHSLAAVTMAWCKTHPEKLAKEKIEWKLRAHCNGIIPWIRYKQGKSFEVSKKQE